MAITQTGTGGIKDDAVTDAKLANAINSAVAANTAKDLTALSAANLTSGTIPDARFPATLPAISGANLTNLPAGGIAASGGTFTGDITVSGGAGALTVASDSEIKLVNGTTDTGDPGSSGSKIQLLNNVTTLRCGASGAKAVSNTGTSLWEITGGGALQPAFNNFFPIGSAGNQVTKIYLSQGVQVGGTGNANLLDDYEEGSFTPTTSGFTNTHNPNGRYVKIGNHIFLSMVFTRSGSTNFTMAGGDNGLTITNLPFACGDFAGVGQVIVPPLNYTGSTNGNGATLIVEPGQAKLYVSGAGFTTPRCNMSVFYSVNG